MVFIDEKTDGFVYNPVSISFCIGFVLKGQPFVHDCLISEGYSSDRQSGKRNPLVNGIDIHLI